MAESQHTQAKDILLKAFAEPQETEKQETAPIEQQEIEAQPVETLETPEGETQQAEQADSQPETEEGEDISTLNHLAETLDIPIEDMYALNFNMPNGDPISLGGLKDFYEQNSDLDTARQEIENERSQLAADREKLGTAQPISDEHVQAIANVRVIEQEYANLENSGLKQSNPGEYSVKALELQNRYNQASGVLQNITQIVEAKRAQKLQTHQQELHKLNPELKEEPKRVEAVGRVTEMFNHFGVNPEYIGAIEDPKAVHMLLEVSKLFEQKGNFRSKRVDTAPKVLKPQAVRNSEAGKSASLKRLTEKARQSGERKDQVRAVSALLNR